MGNIPDHIFSLEVMHATSVVLSKENHLDNGPIFTATFDILQLYYVTKRGDRKSQGRTREKKKTLDIQPTLLPPPTKHLEWPTSVTATLIKRPHT